MSTVQLSTCKQEQYAQNRSNWSNQNIRYVIEGFSKSTLLLYDLIESESFFFKWLPTYTFEGPGRGCPARVV